MQYPSTLVMTKDKPSTKLRAAEVRRDPLGAMQQTVPESVIARAVTT